jgi:maleylacetate reductase
VSDHSAMTFTHDTLGQRVILDAGGARRHLVEELERLDASRAMLIAGPVEQRMADEV